MIALLSVCLTHLVMIPLKRLIFAARKNSCHYFGKPYEVYCNSTFEFSSDNQFVPIENILGIALSCTYTINDETVLVVSPLIS